MTSHFPGALNVLQHATMAVTRVCLHGYEMSRAASAMSMAG